MSIDDTDPFSRVVERIYDAGMGHADWSAVIGEISALVGRGQAALEFVDYSTNSGQLLGLHGYDRESTIEHVPILLENDPWAPLVPWNFAGEHTLGTALLTDSERKSTFFVNELAPVIGMETKDILATFITRTCDHRGAKAAVGALMIYSGENQETFTAADIEIMRRIRPHLVKALELQARLSATETMLQTAGSVVDRAATALWLLDRRGRILFANATALELQQQSSLFAPRGQELHFSNTAAEAALQGAIVAASTHAIISAPHHHGAFLVQEPEHRKPFSVLVAPVSAETMATLLANVIAQPCVAVSIAAQSPDLHHKLALFQELYRLTDAETRVLASLIDGDSPKVAAEKIGVSVWTIRTQLKAIMDKTNCRSQRELMLLVSTGTP
ncbi:MAG: helix-turn-helix transcriptional regulator [Hyphomonadaceae bacterium]